MRSFKEKVKQLVPQSSKSVIDCYIPNSPNKDSPFLSLKMILDKKKPKDE